MLPNLVTLNVENVEMPTLHTIDSIKIDVYSRDHPPPHIHALYAEYEILMEIKTLKTYAGPLPSRQLKMVLEWAKNEKIKEFLLAKFIRLNPNLR